MRDQNGPSQVNIDVIQLAPGWIHIGPGKLAPAIEELPAYLDRTLRDWATKHPAVVVRAAMPITVGGTTIGIHVWYDERESDPA